MRVIHIHDLTEDSRDQILLFCKVLQSGPVNKFELEGVELGLPPET